MKLKTFKPYYIFRLILLLLITVPTSGCIYLVVGGVGVMGGYLVSPDTVEILTENDFSSVWDTSIEVLSVMGRIDDRYEDGGMIIANVGGAKLTLTIIRLSDSTLKVNVKSRKNFLPKVTTAQDVLSKIMQQLNE